ncbi:MAG: hypothetical protein RMJ97_09045 [Raineya sp.]|nr:hypothetical protein [Raineya sp.]MDW8297016.1 hypothetical protein [Raineya sp.]
MLHLFTYCRKQNHLKRSDRGFVASGAFWAYVKACSEISQT